MTDAIDPTLYPSYIYRNKLLFPRYIRTENAVCHNIMDEQVESDFLLYSYIIKLDEEIFQDIPEGLDELGTLMWKEDNWRILAPKILDEARKHGWVMIQFYDDIPRYRLFTKATFSNWITESDEDNIKTRIGAKFNWTDDLGNISEEELLFDDDYTFIFKFREGDGLHNFAFSDLSNALMDLVFNIRQIKGQLDFSGSKPSFKHIKYAANASKPDVNALDAKLQYVDLSAGIGAPADVLESITSVTDDSIKVSQPALLQNLELFAGLVRLPISYFIGHRISGGGMNSKGDITDVMVIDRKKERLLQTLVPFLQDIFNELYGATILTLNIPQEKTIESIEEEDDNKDKIEVPIEDNEDNEDNEDTGVIENGQDN